MHEPPKVVRWWPQPPVLPIQFHCGDIPFLEVNAKNWAEPKVAKLGNKNFVNGNWV